MSASDRAVPRLSDRVLGVAIVAITGMQLMSTLDGTIVIVALPRMQAELAMSDAAKSWVITAYVLTFGGLLLLGGRVGDAIGHKRAFISGVGIFTIASLVCGLATEPYTLIAARAVQGVGAAVAAPTGLALIATTFAVGQARNQALAVSAAMQGLGSVLGLVLGGALTGLSWRLAFLVNVPIGIVIVWIAVTKLAETGQARLKLDVTGALLATMACTCAVLVFTQGPPLGWTDPWVIGAAVAAVVFFIAFLIDERGADNPLVPLSMFDNRNRVASFAAYFLAGGVMLTLSVMIGLLVQDVLGYSPLRAGICFMPFALAFVVGNVVATRLAPRVAPRWVIIGGGALVLAAMLFGSTLDRSIPYFPDLFLPVVVGGAGIGVISVILPLCTLAKVGPREIGPVSSVTLMVYNLGGPLVLVVIQAVQTSRTLYLGGTTGPVGEMTPAQLDALGHGYTYSLLWIAAIAVLVGAAALFIGFSARDIARAQHTKEAVDAGEL
ncbi:MFS transporter [Mycolicibacterium cosmeticum]|uniref:Arabinose efflux permease family protein n=1 Tax=Mycolicibacterium cosmeticum TaxID=258533 RepID=W9B7U4_MYCCO|nr:MFS transporter [Mycolicibacterium cosmeticum]TLH81180.1 MFS transporter [Mycolicibacterium cosmeticum]CDO10761.1 arabinose efflux permease family protein [Mycolicibacterium cosmeticum]